MQKNGTTCEAPAEARWDGAKLVIEEKANPKCADGRTYARNTVNCEVGADGVANARAASRATRAATRADWPLIRPMTPSCTVSA